jgi:hypothetical protein
VWHRLALHQLQPPHEPASHGFKLFALFGHFRPFSTASTRFGPVFKRYDVFLTTCDRFRAATHIFNHFCPFSLTVNTCFVLSTRIFNHTYAFSIPTTRSDALPTVFPHFPPVFTYFAHLHLVFTLFQSLVFTFDHSHLLSFTPHSLSSVST